MYRSSDHGERSIRGTRCFPVTNFITHVSIPHASIDHCMGVEWAARNHMADSGADQREPTWWCRIRMSCWQVPLHLPHRYRPSPSGDSHWQMHDDFNIAIIFVSYISEYISRLYES